MDKPMDRFTGSLLPWLRFSVRPSDAAERVAQAQAPVCYVLAIQRALDVRVLQRACAQAGLPRPRKALLAAGSGPRLQSLLVLSRKLGFWRSRLDRRPPPQLHQMLEALRSDAAFDALLVPVSVYWGRAPRRESVSWLRLLVSEDWALAGGIRRVLAVLLNGRNIVVEFGAGVSLRSLVAEGMPDHQAARRVARHLTGQLDASRTAYVGPDLSHRRTLMTAVLRGRTVRAMVAQHAADKNIPRRQALLEARAMFEEIAADYSHVFVRLMERVLKRLWTRIYDGVFVAHADTIAGIATGSELVYVPCHRSTMDDLLMPYAIYTRGFAVPHIAAGINLDLPVIGRMMRKGGAFFLRRSFRGSPLYSTVFTRYLGAMMARGHPIQYFIEGGRSRTGRSLTPKTGMLSMTLRSYLRQPLRPVVFVPVYIGYERIMEIDSYIGELSGKPKQKENLRGFLRGLARLRENFGHVHVNIGAPIPLQPLLDEHLPDWRDKLGQEGRAAAVGTAVDALAARIMRNIHGAAAVTPVNLLALVMLATPRQAMLEADLSRQLALHLRLLRAAPYSERVTVTALDAPAIIAQGVERGLLLRMEGDAMGLAPEHAPAMAYYRNNVLHLVAIPSLLACCFLSSGSLRSADVLRLAGRIYPYVSGELFLRWEEGQIGPEVARQLDALRDVGLLQQDPADPDSWLAAAAASPEAMQLSVLAQPMLQTLERYYMAIALLLRAGSGEISQVDLARRCQQVAQRIVTLYGFYSPEFFDRTLFDGFLALLRRRGVIRGDAEGKLGFDEVLEGVAEDAQLVLSEQLRHSILQIVHG
ncbi:MAG TPA: glycerol-3-phosphate 1-O-acyltransferase PlsB [Steroidobacteraceae bacterium]|nr:glycerol-3-phosphate 1-O-acyltransferase PlsB [Steroidobacteraceae bacterium]